MYWMELLHEAQAVKVELLQELLTEANEILATAVSSIRTAKDNG